MKNIFEIMKDYGLEIPDDKHKDFEKEVLANYKTSSDYDVQAEKLKTAEGKVTTLTESLEKFKDVNVDELNNTITQLKTDIANKDKELSDKLAERDFMDTLKDSIHAAHGKDAAMIIKLLNVDELRKSKNQKEDIAAAIKEMTENEMTKGMFGETEKKDEKLGSGNLIGQVGKPGGTQTASLKDALRERYNS